MTLRDGGKVIGTRQVRASNSSVVVIPVKKPRLWSPEDPFLYDLTYEVIAPDGQVLDAVKSYVGMRKVHIEGNKVYLNNEPYYQRLVLDQGFYPDGIWTAPSDDALRRDIELGLAAGFNGARLHQKVFEERYYYWADKLGYITWGESPSWGMDANDVETARNFLSEWAECVVRDRNHPSLLTWTPMNEEWWPDNTQWPRFASDVYDLTRRLDPTRPVNTVSGGAIVRTDIWAVHNYEQDPAKLKEKIFSSGTFFHPRLRTTRDQTRNIGFNEMKATENYAWPQYDGSCPYLVDEFGGIKWVKDQEKQTTDRQTESWGYGQAPRTLARVLHPARRPGRRTALPLRTGMGLLLHPIHGRGAGTERHLLLRPFGQIRHGPDQGDFQQTPGKLRPITRRAAARTKRTPKIRKGIFGVRFLSGRHRPPAA